MKKILLTLICSIAIYTGNAQVEKPSYVGSAPAYFDIFTKPAISFNYNSTLLCFSEKIGTVTFYNIMNDAKSIYTLGKESTVVICLFHPKKDEVAIGCKDGQLIIYDYVKQTVVKTIQAHPKSMTAATYSTNGDTLYTAGKEDKINGWNSNGELIQTFETASSAKTIHLRGSQVIYNNEKMGNCVRIIDFATSKEKKIDVSTAAKMDVSKDGKRAYVNCLSAEVEVWNLVTGSLEYKLSRHSGHGQDAVLSYNEKMLLSGGDDNKVIVWDLSTQKPTWIIDCESDVYCICISPDDKYFAVLTNEQKMRFYKTNL